MEEKLAVYKREVANCEVSRRRSRRPPLPQTASRDMREEEGRLENVYNRLEVEAEEMDRKARLLEEEANLLDCNKNT